MSPAPRLAASLVVVASVCTSGGVAARQGRLTNLGELTAVPTVITRDTVILAAERLMVDKMYPPKPRRTVGADIQLPIDVQILMAGSHSVDPTVREAFVRAIGQFEQPEDVEQLLVYLNDASLNVRHQTIQAIVQSLVNATPERDGRAIQMAFAAFRLGALSPSVPSSRSRGGPSALTLVETMRDGFLSAIGELPLDIAQTNAASALFSQMIERSPPSLGAMEGLATLARRRPNVSPSTAALARLRILAAPRGFSDMESPGLPPLNALFALRDRDERVINFNATLHCRPLPNGCWEFRYRAVQMMDGSSDAYGRALSQAHVDTVYHVRMAALRAAAAAIPKTKTCAPLITALDDPMPYVVLQAIDLLNPACDEREDIGARLLSWANELSDSLNNSKWHAPARALEVLVRFRPDDAKRIGTEIAAPHEIWQVRAVAARLAGVLKDEALAERMLRDDEPNVRTEALLSLAEMRSKKRIEAAIAALEHADYQLVHTAARELSRNALGEELAKSLGSLPQEPLMTALKRLTEEKKAWSRDPRLELLARIAEYGDPSDGDALAALAEYLKDEDPLVASAAADTIGKLTGSRPEPTPTKVPLIQPNETDLQNIRKPPPGMTMGAHLWLSDGSHVAFRLVPETAPLTVFRFKQLADTGAYDGASFYRVVPGLLIQGGSPEENQYSGLDRFWRDEINGPHDAGFVATLARGRHTGDGQFFINLLDNPQFNHLYTVFGVGTCMTSHILEGTKITKLVAFAPPAAVPPCVNITPVEPRPWQIPPR
jgi:peptidyl-prolyl cis-trans isomerase B (cyclophilin B)